MDTWDDIFAKARLAFPQSWRLELHAATRLKRKTAFEWLTDENGLLKFVKCLSAACEVYHEHVVRLRYEH